LLVLLKKFPEARLIAGATELGPRYHKRYIKFPTLVSVEAVTELKKIQRTASEWHIGAAVTLTEIEDKLGAEFPMLNDMLRVFGSRQIRNRATMGGNLVTASPSATARRCCWLWMRKWCWQVAATPRRRTTNATGASRPRNARCRLKSSFVPIARPHYDRMKF